MAMCTNQTLLVDWTAPDASLQQYLEPRFIQWNAVITIRQKDFAIYAMDNKENIYLNDPYLLPVNKKLIELKTNVWRKGENATSTSCMKDYLSCYSDATDAQFLYRKAFWALFQWSSRVLHHVSSVRRQIGLNMTKQKKGDKIAKQPHFRMWQFISRRAGVQRLRIWGTRFKDLILKTNNEPTWPLYYQCA
jgi:hypothetical protein